MPKNKVRKHINSLLSGIEKGDFQRKSQLACENLCGLQEFKDASVIMMFLSMAGEIDIDPAIEIALDQGKTVVVPIIIWEQKHMVPVKLDRLTNDMPIDRYGIRYPQDGAAVECAKIDLVVVPGLGFDKSASRLGRGGGYYDRFMVSDGFRGIRCGISFQEQVLEEIPTCDHDIPLDMLVTDLEIRHF